MSATTKTITKPTLRIILSSERLRATLLAAFSGVLLALAFPRAGFAWAAPLGAGALFWTWRRASWKRAFFLGWVCGIVFFTISFWWWSTTIRAYVGPLAYVAVVVSGAIEALAIGLAGSMTAVARARSSPALIPFAAATAFSMTEWLRSIGLLGVPFAQLGITQVDTPLRALGAYVGTSGVTLAVFALGAYGAYALASRSWRALAAYVAALGIATAGAWLAWPARTLPAPRIPVAAVQGNIAQSLKWQPGSLERATRVYISMTQAAIAFHPRLIVWPETVIALNGSGLDQNPELIARFRALATQADATIAIGSIDVRKGLFYNSVFLFTPQGVSGIYDKRQLVPFAEHFPGSQFLWWIPYVGALNGNFAQGDGNDVFPTTAGIRIGPLICWESAFGDIAYADVRHGAQALVVATDDAWFGTSSGPYQHAQIAQMRAIESGEYVVRAAATGISGIITPNGSWQSRVGLNVRRTVIGAIGSPAGSAFARIGPTRIWIAMLALYIVAISIPWRAR
jgi:apolipoprotein N-acyltransferase